MSIDFWGDDEVEAKDTFVSGGGGFDPLPKNTNVLFEIEEIEIKESNEFEQTDFLNIRWNILKPDDYANRKVFQKVRIFHTEKDKRIRARQMLATIDINSGGKLTEYGKKKGKNLTEFTSEDFQVCLVGKSMMGQLDVWRDKDTKEIKGNWVRSISPANAKDVSKPVKNKASPSIKDDDKEDIPWW